MTKVITYQSLEERIRCRLPEYISLEQHDGSYYLNHKYCGRVVKKGGRSLLWNDLRCISCEKHTVKYWNEKLIHKEYKAVEVLKKKTDFDIRLEHKGLGHTIIRDSQSIFKGKPIVCEICSFEATRQERIHTKMRNCEGEIMEIIEYRGCNDMDVRIGKTVIPHVKYGEFVRGTIKSHTLLDDQNSKYLGNSYYNKRYNMWMTITGYKDYQHCDVTFDDGYVAYDRIIADIKKGKCGRDDDIEIRGRKYIGMKVYSKANDMQMEIIAYHGVNDITVRFEDGTVVEHKKLECFKLGMVKYPDKEPKVGRSKNNNDGYHMTIIAYRRSDDLDVMFDDGTIVEHRSMQSFDNGSIQYPKWKQHVGRTVKAHNGMTMKIIAYHSWDNVDVEFEDGTRVYGRIISEFNKGKIGHPGTIPK